MKQFHKGDTLIVTDAGGYEHYLKEGDEVLFLSTATFDENGFIGNCPLVKVETRKGEKLSMFASRFKVKPVKSEFYILQVEKADFVRNSKKEIFRRATQYDPYNTYAEAESAALERMRALPDKAVELVIMKVESRIKQAPVYDISVERF